MVLFTPEACAPAILSRIRACWAMARKAAISLSFSSINLVRVLTCLSLSCGPLRFLDARLARTGTEDASAGVEAVAAESADSALVKSFFLMDSHALEPERGLV